MFFRQVGVELPIQLGVAHRTLLGDEETERIACVAAVHLVVVDNADQGAGSCSCCSPEAVLIAQQGNSKELFLDLYESLLDGFSDKLLLVQYKFFVLLQDLVQLLEQLIRTQLGLNSLHFTTCHPPWPSYTAAAYPSMLVNCRTSLLSSHGELEISTWTWARFSSLFLVSLGPLFQKKQLFCCPTTQGRTATGANLTAD